MPLGIHRHKNGEYTVKVHAVMDGVNLSPASFEDAQEYASIDALKTAFWRASEDMGAGYPTECTVWFYDPNHEDVRGDPYPDEQWTIGPRGGVKRSKC
jgi:hypothetical protein